MTHRQSLNGSRMLLLRATMKVKKVISRRAYKKFPRVKIAKCTLKRPESGGICSSSTHFGFSGGSAYWFNGTSDEQAYDETNDPQTRRYR